MALRAAESDDFNPDVCTMATVASKNWPTPAVAPFLGTSVAALYDAVARGDFDDVVIRVGKRIVWCGPALARKVGLNP